MNEEWRSKFNISSCCFRQDCGYNNIKDCPFKLEKFKLLQVPPNLSSSRRAIPAPEVVEKKRARVESQKMAWQKIKANTGERLNQEYDMLCPDYALGKVRIDITVWIRMKHSQHFCYAVPDQRLPKRYTQKSRVLQEVYQVRSRPGSELGMPLQGRRMPIYEPLSYPYECAREGRKIEHYDSRYRKQGTHEELPERQKRRKAYAQPASSLTESKQLKPSHKKSAHECKGRESKRFEQSKSRDRREIEIGDKYAQHEPCTTRNGQLKPRDKTYDFKNRNQERIANTNANVLGLCRGETASS